MMSTAQLFFSSTPYLGMSIPLSKIYIVYDNVHILIVIDLLSNNHETLFLFAECIFSTLSFSTFPSPPHPAFPTWVPEPENLLEVEAATERACQDSTYDETSPSQSLLPGLLIAHVCD